MNKNNFELDIEILSKIIQNFVEISVSYAGQIIGAALILIFGFYLAGKLSGIVRKNLEKFNKLDPLIIPIIGNVVRYGIIVLTIIAVLNQFGVQTTVYVVSGYYVGRERAEDFF